MEIKLLNKEDNEISDIVLSFIVALMRICVKETRFQLYHIFYLFRRI